MLLYILPGAASACAMSVGRGSNIRGLEKPLMLPLAAVKGQGMWGVLPGSVVIVPKDEGALFAPVRLFEDNARAANFSPEVFWSDP